jgi:hypothetical protein
VWVTWACEAVILKPIYALSLFFCLGVGI